MDLRPQQATLLSPRIKAVAFGQEMRECSRFRKETVAHRPVSRYQEGVAATPIGSQRSVSNLRPLARGRHLRRKVRQMEPRPSHLDRHAAGGIQTEKPHPRFVLELHISSAF